MKIRSLAAALAVATLTTTSLLATPAASASTVQISGLTCAITFTPQDFNVFRAHFASYEDTVASRLKVQVPGVNAEIDLLMEEVVDIALNDGAHSTAGTAAWSKYFAAGRTAGFTNNDLVAMIFLGTTPSLATHLLTFFEFPFVDTQVVTRDGAQFILDGIEVDFGIAEEVLESGRYNAIALSPRAKTVIAPAGQVIDDFHEAVTEPWQACLDGKSGTFRIGTDTINPPDHGGGNGDGGDNGSGGGNGDGNGGGGNGGGSNNGNGGGGSSFGSS